MSYLDNLDDIVYYLYLNDKYIDFQTIMYLTNKDKSYMWRLLIKSEIPYIDYQNRRLYKFNNIVENIEIMELLDIDKIDIFN